MIVSGHSDNTARLRLAAMVLQGDPARITCWVQVITGMDLDEGGAVRILSAEDGLSRKRRLEALGGPPITSTVPVAWRH